MIDQIKKYLPGLRIIKTVIAVLICLVLFFALGNYKPIYAAIACVLMMKETHEKTWEVGVHRIIGTFLGGIVSMVSLLFTDWLMIASHSMIMPFVIATAILIDLSVSKLLKLDAYVASMSGVVTLITLLSYATSQGNAVTYVTLRMQETIVGIIIAFLVNRYLNFGKPYTH